MKISVVIPCYNAAQFLRRAVHSVEQQGIDGTEIIVVDDASTDGTVAVAEQLRGELANLRIIRQPVNGGAAKARNAGLPQASGEYVCFLDADDAYGEGVFARVLAEFDRAPWIQAIDFPVRLVDSHREVSPLHLRIITNSLPSNLVVRRELALAVGGFPESPAFRTKQAGEDAVFRKVVGDWASIIHLNDVFLDYTIRRGGHLDVFMDRARVDNNGLRLLPEEDDKVVAQGVAEYLRQTRDRMLVQAGIPRRRVLEVKKGDRGVKFETFDSEASSIHATQTLEGKTYPPIPFLSDVASVLDIGANIGASAVIFAMRYPNARIVAVEPSRQPYILLRCNTAAHAKVECYNVGLFRATTKQTLFLGGPDSVTNSVVQNRLSSPIREEIQLVAADAFTADVGMTRPDIIKIDTEGCEVPIISAMLESFRAAKAVYLEYHNERDRREIDKLLGETHVLYFGKVPFPHRGELVYVRNDAFPTEDARGSLANR